MGLKRRALISYEIAMELLRANQRPWCAHSEGTGLGGSIASFVPPRVRVRKNFFREDLNIALFDVWRLEAIISKVGILGDKDFKI